MPAAAADQLQGGVAVGRVFGRAFAAIRCSPGPILFFSFLCGAVPGVGVSYALAEVDKLAGVEPDWLVVGAGTAAAIIAWSLLGSLTQALLTRGVTAEAKGRRAGVGESIAAVARVAPALLGVSVATTLAITAGLLLLIVPGVALMLIWAVVIPVTVEERCGIGAALRRSGLLTKGARWSILGLMLMLLMLSLGASTAVEIATGQWNNSDMATLVRDPLYMTLTVASQTALSAIWGTAIAALYVELKLWKDGSSAEELEQVFA